MRKITQITVKVYLVAALLGLPALADTTLSYKSGSKDFVVKIRDGAVRIDDGSKRWQLYRQDEGAIYSVEPGAKSYHRMDEQAAAAIKSEMNKLRESMDKQLAQLPPAQRQAARAALANQIPGMDDKAQDVGLDRSGRSDNVAGIECEPVTVVRDGKPGERLCVATADALGMSGGEFGTVSSMFKLMENMLTGTGLEYVGLPYLNFDGMPIRYQQPDGGARVLKSVAHEDVAADEFEIPPSYSERSPGFPR